MSVSDEHLHRLRAAIEDLAVADAADLLEQARADARERALSILTDTLTASMLEQIESRQSSAVSAVESSVPVEPVPPLQPSAPPVESSAASVESSASSVEPPVGSVEPSGGSVQPFDAEMDQDAGASRREIARYVYGIIDAGSLTIGDSQPPGIQSPYGLEIVTEGSLAAVWSGVGLDEFDDARLRANLADMAWVEQVARGHEQVLEWIRSQTTVIPMRMCTVYRTDGGVREMLGRECAALRDALEHLDGTDEWGVKVFFHRAQRPAPEPPSDELGSGSDAGSQYMQRRRDALNQAEEDARAVEEAAARVHEELCANAVDGLVAPLQRREVSGHAGDMVLNGVYLVERGSASRFHETADMLQEEFRSLGLALVQTGPWPAYNFVPGTVGAGW